MRMAMLVRALAVWGTDSAVRDRQRRAARGAADPAPERAAGPAAERPAAVGPDPAAERWLLPWIGLRGRRAQLLTGLGWLALTLGFEFSFGLLRGRTLDEILAAYRFEGSNLWPLVLLVTACAPWLVGWLRRR